VAPLDITRLGRIDWDFPRAGTVKGSVQSIHWFPGNFIAQIPSALIQVLSHPNDLVFDPFAGSATTAVEALKLGRAAIVSDRLSVSGLIGEAKLAILSHGMDTKIIDDIRAELTFDQQCRSKDCGSRNAGADASLIEWYSEDTLAQLRYLWKLIEPLPSAPRKILTAVFSDVLFQCASTGGAVTRTGKKRRHHWGWVADNVRPKNPVEHNAIELFRTRLSGLPASGLSIGRGEGQLASFVQQDARSLAIGNNIVNLVVTSPPYIGMIDYAHANRLLYAWMGWSLRLERDAEIGARYRRSRKTVVNDYLMDMRLARDEISRVLRPGGFCAIILGQSKRFPGTVEQVFADFGDVMSLVWGPVARNPTRRRVSDRAAGEPVEYIAVFQKHDR
jgi:hypothetical protein